MGTGRGGPARRKVTCGSMFLPVLRETPCKPSVWEGSSKSPCLLKNIKVSPIFSHFTDQRGELSRAREGQKSQGNDEGRRYSSPACSWAPPGAGPSPSLGFRLARQPHKTRSAFSSPRSRGLCLAAQFTPENPTASRAFSFVMIKVEAV